MSSELAKEIADKLSRSRPKERGEIVKYYGENFDISRGKVYKLAKEGGFRSKKKERADKGIIKCGVEVNELKLMAGMQKQTKRKNRKMLMPTTHALVVYNRARRLEGKEIITATASTINLLMRKNGISRKEMLSNWTTDDHKTPAFCKPLTAEFCNEYHVFDITPCTQYYFKEKGGLGQRDKNLELYDGKPQNYKALKKHLHRYVMIDFKSQVYLFKYYYSSGENLADLLNFLYFCWSFKDDFPFCGVPFNMYSDKGSAFKNQFLKSVCERLGINLEHHKAGNSRAKGIVEERMKFLQEHFECELAFKSAGDVNEINNNAYEFMKDNNANFVHTRMRATRLAVWTAMIRTEHKRLLDCDRDTFFGMATSEPRRAKVDSYKCIRFNGAEYLIHGPVNKDEWVLVDYNYLDRNNIRVWKIDIEGNKGEQLAAQLIKRNVLGEREDAVKLGEYKRHEDTPVQVTMKEMDKLDYSKIREAAFKYDLEEKPSNIAFIERPGTPIWKTEEKPVTWARHEVFKEIRFRLKMERLTPLQSQLIEKLLEDKEVIEESLIEEICNRFRGEGEIASLFDELAARNDIKGVMTG